ncbi:MAG: hypothetical protein WC292_06530 [Clostridia bacterium]
MSAKKLAILNIGSDEITLVLQDGKYTGSLLFMSTAAYAGFQDGEFLEIEGLFSAIDGLVKECAEAAFFKPTHILVGVPGEFTAVVCKNVVSSFPARRKVVTKDVELLFEEGNTYDDHPNFKTINASPIYFLNEKGEKSINPTSMQAKTFTAYMSYILCERSFISLFDRIADSLNLKFDYTSSMLAEFMFVVPPEVRDKGVVLADIGYISSTVAYGKGDGLLLSAAFSAGGGHIAGDLTTCLSIPFDHAMELTPKINLNLQPGESDLYMVSVKGEAFSYNIKEVNEVAYYRVKDIAEIIDRALKSGAIEVPPQTGILLTGGGISTIVGAKEIISEATGRTVKLISADLLQFNKPAQSSLAGLILLQQQKYGKRRQGSFLQTLFSLFRRNK